MENYIIKYFQNQNRPVNHKFEFETMPFVMDKWKYLRILPYLTEFQWDIYHLFKKDYQY